MNDFLTLDRFRRTLRTKDRVEPCYQTVFNWYKVGIKRGGKRIKLRTRQGTKGRETCRQWYDDFVAALQGGDE